eukprot:TRINITY_DN7274_c0_g1_i1.p1 TRINITY_DN7274_c0_g1~~TRINITY_DN7274_c0_g1_i1.p1  ORF type:complete len:741 (-),score=210.13 TRINITY_DN7274_c0_g1_i1:693-2915(-)
MLDDDGLHLAADLLPPEEDTYEVLLDDQAVDSAAAGTAASSSPAASGAASSDKNKKDDSSSSTNPPPATFSELFVFASPADRALRGVGWCAAILQGAAMPAFSLLLGDMLNIFEKTRVEADCDAGTTLTPTHPLLGTGNASTATPPDTPTAEMLGLPALGSVTGSFVDTVDDLALIFVGLAVFTSIVAWLAMVGPELAVARQALRMRSAFFRALITQDLAWFDTHRPEEMPTRLVQDVYEVTEGVGLKLSQLWTSMATFVIGLILAFIRGWQMGLLSFALLPIIGVVMAIAVRVMTSSQTVAQTSYAKAGAVAEEVFSSIRTVHVYQATVREARRYAANLGPALRAGTRKGSVLGVATGSIWLAMWLSYALAFWFGTWLIQQGVRATLEDRPFNGGDVITCFFAIIMAAFSLGGALPNVGNIASARGAAAKTLQVLRTTPTIGHLERPFALTLPPTPPAVSCVKAGALELNDVTFRYPARPETAILDGTTLRIDPGQTVALVGKTGCGKSTILGMLLRWYDPHSGTVLVDGLDVRSVPVRALRAGMAVVSQEPVLFATSIRQNLTFGLERAVSDAELREALEMANAAGFVYKLPKGLETFCGEGGGQLSGGQKQRIAIARALLRRPRILLLDEATSALDSASETAVQQALDTIIMGESTDPSQKNRGKLSVIMIAHRLSTVRNADTIVVLDSGRVVEAGPFVELRERPGGRFRAMWEASGAARGPDASARSPGDLETIDI